MKRIIVAFLVLVLFAACSKNNGYVEIRVRNLTPITIENIIVEGQNFGDLTGNETTLYKDFKEVYPSLNVSFTVEGIAFEYVPNDHVGEELLSGDRYAIEITYIDGEASFILKQE